MNPYGNQNYLKKKVSYDSQKNSEKPYPFIKLIHHIFNTINITLVILIFILFFLSFDSQRKWSKTYSTLNKTKVFNNNLIDYISNTEEFYISELENLNKYRNTKPKDLIYLKRITEKEESLFKNYLRVFIEGLSESRYQIGY